MVVWNGGRWYYCLQALLMPDDCVWFPSRWLLRLVYWNICKPIVHGYWSQQFERYRDRRVHRTIIVRSISAALHPGECLSRKFSVISSCLIALISLPFATLDWLLASLHAHAPFDSTHSSGIQCATSRCLAGSISPFSRRLETDDNAIRLALNVCGHTSNVSVRLRHNMIVYCSSFGRK